MDLHVGLQGRDDLSGQIYRQVRAAVLDGRLRPGEAVPPTRKLAEQLQVSRNTVSAAYDRLTAEGFLVTRLGAGTFVAAGVAARPRTAGATGPLRPLPIWARIPGPPTLRDEPEFDFRPGLPDASLFPYETWRRLLARELRAAAVGAGMYGDPAGQPRLRAAIARHIGVSRAVRADPADVIVTAGAQQALDLVARVLLRPGSTVAVEDPGYPPARQLFASHGVRVAGVPVDRQGLVVDAIPDRARVVFLAPSHQFPLGVAMSLERRMALLDWAERHDALIVEDDYDSEFRYGGRPIEPLHSLDATGRVLYVGSFSKVMLPTLRLGLLVATPPLREALRAAKYVTGWHNPQPDQGALAAFIDEGLLARHIRRMRLRYQARHEHIGQILARDFTGLLDPVPSAAGLHLSAMLPQGSDDQAVARRARRDGVGLFALSEFAIDDSPPGLVLGYGAIQLARIEPGLTRLHEVITQALGASKLAP